MLDCRGSAMNYRTLHALIAAAENACRELSVCWSLDRDECRRRGDAEAAALVENRRAGILSLAAELRANAADLALARDLVELRSELDCIIERAQAARSAWSGASDSRRASVTGSDTSHIITAKQETPGTGIPEASTDSDLSKQERNGCNVDGA
jgi:hypothetical protein